MSISRTRSRPTGYWTNGTYTRRRRTYFGVSQILVSDTTTGSPENGKLRDRTDETCDDYLSTSLPYPDHPLTINRHWFRPTTVSGNWETTTVSGSLTHHDEFSFDEFGPLRLTHNVFCPGARAFDSNYWSDKAKANVNPLRPVVDLPLFLFELREFPRMLRDLGRVLQKRVSLVDVPGGHLAGQFGWGPLLKDALTLFNFTLEIDKRKRFFENLEEGKNIRRTLLREEDIEVSSVESELGLSWRTKTTKSRRIWYSAGWKLHPDWTLPELAHESTRLSTLLGVGSPKRGYALTASTIWNAIPWTWLIDYLTNIGTILEANRGNVPLQLHSMCLMCEDVDRTVPIPIAQPPGVQWTHGHLSRTMKRRFVIGVPTSRVRYTAFLTQRQYSILGSLALVTAVRRFRL